MGEGRMKRILSITLLLLCCALSVAQHQHAPAKSAGVALMPGLGDLHHPVTTSNPEAQKFFDQGLRLTYAFNHQEATSSFRRAAELDPRMAMAYWGIAKSVGPNYNDPADPDRFRQAHEAVQKAQELAANASPGERAYIAALARRFP